MCVYGCSHGYVLCILTSNQVLHTLFLICGLYREWTKNGDVTQEKQLQSIQIV